MIFLGTIAIALVLIVNTADGFSDLNESITIVDTITCGSSINGSMNGVGVQYYAVNLVSPDWDTSYTTVVFDTCDSDYDNYLWFYNEDGEYLDEEDDSCGYQAKLKVSGLIEGYYYLGVGACCSKTKLQYGNFTMNVICSNETSTMNSSTTTATTITSDNTSDECYSAMEYYWILDGEQEMDCGYSEIFETNGTSGESNIFRFYNDDSSPEDNTVFRVNCVEDSDDLLTVITFYNSDGCEIDYQVAYEGCNEYSFNSSFYDNSNYYYALVWAFYDGPGNDSNDDVYAREYTVSYECNGTTTDTPWLLSTSYESNQTNYSTSCLDAETIATAMELNCDDIMTVKVNWTGSDTLSNLISFYYDESDDDETVLTANCEINDNVTATTIILFDIDGCLIEYQHVWGECNEYIFDSNWSTGCYYAMVQAMAFSNDTGDTYTISYECDDNDDSTLSPSNIQTQKPTSEPTTKQPTDVSTSEPTSEKPSQEPTVMPTEKTTAEPTTKQPSDVPTSEPTSEEPSQEPTVVPTETPTQEPTTVKPTTEAPTVQQSEQTENPTQEPTVVPITSDPTVVPTQEPTVPVSAASGYTSVMSAIAVVIMSIIL